MSFSFATERDFVLGVGVWHGEELRLTAVLGAAKEKENRIFTIKYANRRFLE